VVGQPRFIQRGYYHDMELGTYWAWPIDGYWDLHFVYGNWADGYPDGSDVIAEGFRTYKEAETYAQEIHKLNKTLHTLEGAI